MNWYSGEISAAIQKAIRERKVFIVFVKGENDDSRNMEEVWQDHQVAEVCSDDKCVAINISQDSMHGQQFSSIYPILCLPSTYLINNEGLPTDIIPGLMLKEEFLDRLKQGIQATFGIPAVQPETEDETVNTQHASSTKEESQDAQELSEQAEDENVLSPKERAEQLLEKSRSLKAEKDKQKLREQEGRRREDGQEMSMAKRDIAERQARQLADEIAKKKGEEKAARERVREQLRQDKADKAARFENEKKARQQAQVKRDNEKKALQAQVVKTDSNIARIQFRLPNGSTTSNQFNADAKFIEVDNFVKEYMKDPNLRMTTVYPKHEFDSEDMLKSLRELGLVPNASIIISPGRAQSTNVATATSFNPLSLIMLTLAPIFGLFTWIASLFGSTSQTSRPTNTSQATTYNNSRSAATVRRRVLESSSDGNIHRIRYDDSDDDENKTWNGNSTQQM